MGNSDNQEKWVKIKFWARLFLCGLSGIACLGIGTWILIKGIVANSKLDLRIFELSTDRAGIVVIIIGVFLILRAVSPHKTGWIKRLFGR